MDNLIHADCLDAMAAMDAESIDAIVTDPPYGIRFMGKAWDGADIEHRHRQLEDAREARGDTERSSSGWGNPAAAAGQYDQSLRGNHAFQAWCEAWAREAFRIAKPGAHLLAFGGTRTVHRLAAAIEDAGWEIRDMLVWGYASGFPKSLDVSKAIDKAAGAEREVVGENPNRRPNSQPQYSLDGDHRNFAVEVQPLTAPATPAAEKWNGWGTALKPAWEPIVMARKPLRGTVAANVLAHGTGALNIDGTRIASTDVVGASGRWGFTTDNGWNTNNVPSETSSAHEHTNGRWPANLILTDPIFDGGIEGVVGGGETTTGSIRPYEHHNTSGIYGGGDGWRTKSGQITSSHDGDSGTYSRFFLVPKSSRSDREPVINPDGHDRTQRFSTHPTQKPTALMRHLVRLVTPPGGTVLDPFLGSGTTALACEMEGFAWIGIEKEAEYIAITEARLNGTQRGLGLVG